MEESAEDILNCYFQCIKNNNLHELSEHFASNAVLDWYGRTLKTPRLISDHFR